MVAILPNVYGEILVSQGCIVREIKPVYPSENQSQLPWPIVSSITPIKPGFTRSLLSVSDKRFFFFF